MTLFCLSDRPCDWLTTNQSQTPSQEAEIRNQLGCVVLWLSADITGNKGDPVMFTYCIFIVQGRCLIRTLEHNVDFIYRLLQLV